MVTLTKSDLARIEALAHARNDPKIGVVATKRVDRSKGDLQLNLEGLKAEFAVARYLEIPIEQVDHAVSLRGRTRRFDLSYATYRIEVKFNSYASGDLYFNSLNDVRGTDYVVLVVPAAKGSLRIVGYLSREEFIDKCKVKDYGYGNRLAVPQWELRPVEELKKMAKPRLF